RIAISSLSFFFSSGILWFYRSRRNYPGISGFACPVNSSFRTKSLDEAYRHLPLFCSFAHSHIFHFVSPLLRTVLSLFAAFIRKLLMSFCRFSKIRPFQIPFIEYIQIFHVQNIAETGSPQPYSSQLY